MVLCLLSRMQSKFMSERIRHHCFSSTLYHSGEQWLLVPSRQSRSLRGAPNPPELTSDGQAAHLKCRRLMQTLQIKYQLIQNLQDRKIRSPQVGTKQTCCLLTDGGDDKSKHKKRGQTASSPCHLPCYQIVRSFQRILVFDFSLFSVFCSWSIFKKSSMSRLATW